MKFFDLHCHPTLKTFLGAAEENKRQNCWEEVNVSGIWEIVDKIIGDILDSQCSLEQVSKGNVRVATAALYSLEKPIVTGEIAKIKDIVVNFLLLSNFIPELSHDLLNQIATNELTYNEVLKQMKIHLLNSQNLEATYNLLNRIEDLDENRLNIILAIEGAHALFNDIEHYSDNEVLNNLKELKEGSNYFLYLTLTHLTQSPLCTHAFGMKMMKDPTFYPVGYGISELGKKVIDVALDNTKGKRIIVDIKHMSLQSRLEYYKMINNKYKGVPIIGSHMGFNGVSYNEMPIASYKEEGEQVIVNYYKPKGLMRTEFNPWSINLYNEEIPIIVQSGGLLGIIMDERILGCKQDVKEEYFSKEEFARYQSNADKNLNKFQKLEKKEQNEQAEEEALDLLIFNKQLRHLANNILHVVKIGGQATGESVWNHVCMGSDFDGLVDAIVACKKADKFPKLHDKLVNILPKMAKSDPSTNYYIDEKNAKQRVDSFMYQNAINFLQKNFTAETQLLSPYKKRVSV